MPSLVDIPDEVLLEIISPLEGKEIQAIRRTCSKLCRIASPYLFKTLYLSPLTMNLDVFRLVAANPLILGGVRQLVIDDTTVSPILLDENTYRSMSRHENLWKKRKIPYFSDADWDYEGRVWSTEADNECFRLLKFVYAGHEANLVEQRDIAALRDALAGMSSLRSLVLSNRTADDEPQSGAQSKHNSSPVVKLWREVGKGRRERPPFPPRVDWWAPLEDDEYEGDEVFDMEYIYDGLHEHLLLNGGTRFHNPALVEELNDEDDGGDGVQAEEDDNAVHSEDGLSNDDDDANLFVDVAGNAQANPHQHYAIVPFHHSSLPAAVRALRREARGLQIATEILRDVTVQSRLTEFRVDASLDTLADIQTPGLSMRVFDFLAPPYSSRLSTSFLAMMFLTRFELVLSSGRDQGRGQEILEQGQVASVLAAMPHLRHLMIEAHGMGVIDALPHGVTFSNLRSVEFACGIVSRQEIRQFLHRHRSSLESFRVLYCSLDLDEGDVQDSDWGDVAEDVKRMQAMGTTSLQSAAFVSVYSTIPFTGCGRNRTKSRPAPGEDVHSWTLGTDETIIICPQEDLGHEALPEP